MSKKFWQIMQIILIMMFTSFNYPVKADELKWSKLPFPKTGRYDPVVLLDKKNNRMLVWGGVSLGQRLPEGGVSFAQTELESLDLTTKIWTSLKTSGDKPPAGLYGSGAILDSLRNRIIVFGGVTLSRWSDPEVYYNNLWLLNLTNLVWSKLTPSGTWPSPRASSTAINDISRMIVFGGSSGWRYGIILSGHIGLTRIYPYPCYNELWALDLATLTWSKLNPAGSLPSGRDCSVAIRDAKNNRMIIFGGQNQNCHNENYCVEDLLWSLDLGSLTWSQLHPSGESPSQRFSAGAVYDNIGNMILFGGKYDPEPFVCPEDRFSENNCYSLNLSPGKESWTKLPFEISPSARYGHKMVFEKQQTILFGGQEEQKVEYFLYFLNETWVFKKITTSISLNNLQFTYDGKPKQATVTTNPEGLDVSVTYNGSKELPVDIGTYVVIAEHRGDTTHEPAYAEGVLIIVARPQAFVLYQNYPNPFNLTTTIKYELPEKLAVILKIFNVLGQEVATLLDNEYQELGYFEIKWNAAGYPSGIYFYQIKAGKFQEIRKMILVK